VEALILAKDLERALTEVRAARQKFADDEDLLALEANVLEDRGDRAGAIALMDGLRKKSPRDLDVLMRVAQFHQRAKRLPEAEAVLRPGARDRAAQPQRALPAGRRAGAPAPLRRGGGRLPRGAVVQPDFAAALNYLGYMNADRRGEVAEAVGLIEKAIALDPENGAYLDSLGWALYRQDKLVEAEEYLRRAGGEGERCGRARPPRRRARAAGQDAEALASGSARSRRGRGTATSTGSASPRRSATRRPGSARPRRFRSPEAGRAAAAAGWSGCSPPPARPCVPPAPEVAAGRAPSPPTAAGEGAAGRTRAARPADRAARVQRPDALRIELPGPAGCACWRSRRTAA
jgi:hypothetical protein